MDTCSAQSVSCTTAEPKACSCRVGLWHIMISAETVQYADRAALSRTPVRARVPDAHAERVPAEFSELEFEFQISPPNPEFGIGISPKVATPNHLVIRSLET
jgi:hypothetical protein